MDIDLSKLKKPGPEDNKPEEEGNYDLQIKPVSPNKAKSHFKRGNLVLCLVFSPEESRGEFKNLRKEETLLTDKQENQKFLIVEKPALELSYKSKTYPVFVCDAEKGVTVGIDFIREEQFAKMCCDPHMISNVFDESFISKASNIKMDWKQLVGVALFGFVFGGLVGLLF